MFDHFIMTCKWASLVLYAAMFYSCQPDKKLSFQSPPNVVLILTDDQGYGDVQLHGNKEITTPNIDQAGRTS